MKLTLWLITFLSFAAVNAVAADLTYSIAIGTTESEKIMGELVSERFWKSYGAKQPFETEEKQTTSEFPDGTRKENKFRGIKEGTTATLELGPAKLHLKLVDFGISSYEFLITTENWDPQKLRFPNPANATLKVTVDEERAFSLFIIECKGLPEGLPKIGESGMSQVLTIFASNLKTLIETGKPMFDVNEKPKPGKSAPPKP